MNKIEKLQETKTKLKSEFVGINEIIDKVIDSITPWYLTPEVLERPVVVSLWGLTGTGKTSLIRKLINYLDLSGKTLLFDCGEQGGSSDTRLFSEKLDELFEASQILENDVRYSEEELSKIGVEINPEAEVTRTNPLDYTFIFDEFQYLKTKNPTTGEEESRPEGRAIWSLMDSGLIDINSYNYKLKSLMDYLEDMEVFSESYPGIEINDGRFPREYVSLLKQQLSYYRWAENEEEEEDKEASKKGYKVLFDEDFSFLIKKLNLLQKGLGFKVGDKLKSFTKLSDFVLYINDYIELIPRPKVINCSKSLIFVLGNLDEAFDLTGEDLDPDIDADVYHELTSKVNCMDIKTALRKRFRDEQIGRLGNNIIIYPSLRRCDFEEIINRELQRIKNKFKNHNGIDITFSSRLKNLIYSEGCFPIQGVRPLFSTINYIVSPLLSLILMSGKKEQMVLDVSGENFNVPQIKLTVDSLGDKSRIGEKLIQLNLGSLRSPERCKKLGLQAIHEASHAVVYHLLTSKLPSAIIASNIFGSGGYMMNEVDTDSSTENVWELRNDIIVSLAGYYGERHFFEKDMCSLGASSDIDTVWRRLRDAYYQSGMSTPISFSEKSVSIENTGLPFGFPVEENPKIHVDLLGFFEDCCEKTKEYIKDESYLIAKISEYLLENRSMSTKVFKKFVEDYGKTFGEINIPDENYYTNTIKEYINEY